MKTMKTILIITIFFSFTQCASSKFEEKPPFKIEKTSYNTWVGGQPGVSGTRVEIVLKEKSNINFDSLFFQKKATKVDLNLTSDKTLLIGHFNTSNRQNRDLILDDNSTKEIKNSLPKVKTFPFNLKENEAILSYKIGDKTKYFKIKNIKLSKDKFSPSAIKVQ